MKLIPYHRFEFSSGMSSANVLAAMAARIEQHKWFRITALGAANDERFDGTVAETGFSVTRIMGYRNSFAPVIDGEVHAAGAFSRVVITMRPSIFVLVFAAFFSFFFVSVFFGIEDGAFWPALAAPALLYAMMLFGFWLEANKIEQTLRRILKAT